MKKMYICTIKSYTLMIHFDCDYMDGARLGYGLAASPDVTLKDIARLCDVFYIGGTKVGALCNKLGYKGGGC